LPPVTNTDRETNAGLTEAVSPAVSGGVSATFSAATSVTPTT
jgi:hypothetical protein